MMTNGDRNNNGEEMVEKWFSRTQKKNSEESFVVVVANGSFERGASERACERGKIERKKAT